MKKVKSIQSMLDPSFGLGMVYLDPISTFHAPSLSEQPEPKATKLMKRLLKQEEERTQMFRHQLILRQPRNVLPHVNVAMYDPSPLRLPPLFFSKDKSR